MDNTRRTPRSHRMISRHRGRIVLRLGAVAGALWISGCGDDSSKQTQVPVTILNTGGASAPAAHGGMGAVLAGSSATAPVTPATSTGTAGSSAAPSGTPMPPPPAAGMPNPPARPGPAAPMPGANPAPAGGGSMTPLPAGSCSREQLRGMVDMYLVALASHDPSSLPKAPSLKFTENTKTIQLGEGVLWKTAAMVKFSRSIFDTERCGTVTEGVIPNNGTDTIFGLRLKLTAERQLVEVEQIVVDPMTGFSPMPNGLLNSKSQVWDDVLPPEQRSTREQLEAAGRAYFMAFQDPMTPVPYNKPCDRLENGTQTTFGDCSNFGPAGGGGFRMPASRYPVSDLEAGATAGFLLFGGGMIDFHMFKVIGGKIRWIHAVVGPTAFSSGWPMQ